VRAPAIFLRQAESILHQRNHPTKKVPENLGP